MFNAQETGRALPNGTKTLLCWTALGLVIGGFCLPARADLLEESHQYQHEILSPAYGSTFVDTINVDQFDSFGGARELLGIRFDYFLLDDTTVIVHDNPYSYSVGCAVRSEMSWFGAVTDDALLPVDSSFCPLGVGGGTGVGRGPFSPGETWMCTGGGISFGEDVSDPAYLTALTGSGLYGIQSTIWLSDAEKLPPDSEGEEDPFEFWPGLLDVVVDRIYMDLTVTYVYTPEPSTAALFCLGAWVTLRRRR